MISLSLLLQIASGIVIRLFSFIKAPLLLRTDSHQALFFHQAILVFKNSALDGFYPFLVVFNKMVTD